VTFPIILSNGPPPTGFQTVADAGVTMIRAGRADWNEATLDAQIADERALLDDAAAHGLKCWVWLGALTNLAAGAAGAPLRRVVEALRTHPALGAWKGQDEPRNPFNPALSIPPDNLARGHRLVASLDPDHPLVIIQAPRGSVDGLVPYRPAFDIGGVDIYPVSYPPGIHSDFPNRDISVVGDVTQWIRRAAGTKPVWVTLQIAWSGVTPTKTNPDRVPRFPSNAELRFMAYQAIANGARGLAFFGGHITAVQSPADAGAGWNWTFWRQSLERLVRELSSTAVGPAVAWTNAGVDYIFDANGQMNPAVPSVALTALTVDGHLVGNVTINHGLNGMTQFAEEFHLARKPAQRIAPASPNDLEGDCSIRAILHGFIDGPHATFADWLQKFVGSDLGAGMFGRWDFDGGRRRIAVLQEAAKLGLLCEQGDNAAAKVRVAGAGLIEKRIPFDRIAQLAGSDKDVAFVHDACAGSRRPPDYSAYSARRPCKNP